MSEENFKAKWRSPRMVLGFKLGECVQVNDVNVQFLSRKGNYIRLAIHCPRGSEIKRGKEVDE